MYPEDKLFVEGENNSELREKREAIAKATCEFYRVKREKLGKESQLGKKATNNKEQKQLNRERANRASAAASRAKIVCYAKELEKRTDKLEQERNHQMKIAEKAIQKLNQAKENNDKLKKILRSLWERRDPNTCSYILESNALVLIAPKLEGENEEEMRDKKEFNTQKFDEKSMEVSQNCSVAEISNRSTETNISKMGANNNYNNTNNVSTDLSTSWRRRNNGNHRKQSKPLSLRNILAKNNGIKMVSDNDILETKEMTPRIASLPKLEKSSGKRGYSVSQLVDPLPRPIDLARTNFAPISLGRRMIVTQKAKNLDGNTCNANLFGTR